MPLRLINHLKESPAALILLSELLIEYFYLYVVNLIKVLYKNLSESLTRFEIKL